jgi:hypothetical protein
VSSIEAAERRFEALLAADAELELEAVTKGRRQLVHQAQLQHRVVAHKARGAIGLAVDDLEAVALHPRRLDERAQLPALKHARQTQRVAGEAMKASLLAARADETKAQIEAPRRRQRHGARPQVDGAADRMRALANRSRALPHLDADHPRRQREVVRRRRRIRRWSKQHAVLEQGHLGRAI